MVDINFECPRCNQKLAIEAAGAGIMVNCPACQQLMTVPSPPDEDEMAMKRTQHVLPFEYAKSSPRTKAA